MQINKVIKVILLIILVIVAGITSYIIAGKLAFIGWINGTTGKSEEIKESNLGDKFLFRYVTRDFPDVDTTVTIMNYQDKEKIIYFVINGEFYNSDIVTIIVSYKIRVYEVYGVLIYRINNSNFNGVVADRIEKLDPTEHPLFIEVAKDLVSKNEWKWIKVCGKFLLKAGDIEIRKIFERYALGQFPYEELELNRNSQIKKEDMQAFAMKILEQK